MKTCQTQNAVSSKEVLNAHKRPSSAVETHSLKFPVLAFKCTELPETLQTDKRKTQVETQTDKQTEGKPETDRHP